MLKIFFSCTKKNLTDFDLINENNVKYRLISSSLFDVYFCSSQINACNQNDTAECKSTCSKHSVLVPHRWEKTKKEKKKEKKERDERVEEDEEGETKRNEEITQPVIALAKPFAC